MKKKAAALLLIFLVFAAVCLPVSAAEPFTLLEWNGFELRVLSFEIHDSVNPADLQINARVINNTDHSIWIRITDARVDSTPVTSAGRSVEAHTDTGDNNPKILTFFPEDLDDASASEAVRTGTSIDMTISLVDDKTYHSLYETHVTFDLDNSRHQSPGGSVYTSASDYSSLARGNSGEAVRNMQQRLIDLGYLNDKADGVFGQKTLAAVRSFCDQNSLTVGQEATPEMQALLYSTRAKTFVEPWNPLMIGSRSEWESISSVNTFFFKIQVTNTSQTRTIKGFELKCYLTNLWGERIADDPIYSQTTRASVAPGETVWSNSFNLGYWASVDTVWVGVSRIVFDDGEVRDIDDVDYYSVVLNK